MYRALVTLNLTNLELVEYTEYGVIRNSTISQST